MTMHRLPVVCAVGLVLALGACSGVKEQLGLGKHSPDEFRVASRAPLSMPPNFYETPPPQPGAARPQEGTPQQQARQTIFRNEEPAEDLGESAFFFNPPDAAAGAFQSPGERALLSAAGADKAQAGIRKVVDAETDRVNREEESFLDNLVFWRKEPPPGVVVDAAEENRRLRENAALGKPATTGRTPTIERRKKALFEGIF